MNLWKIRHNPNSSRNLISLTLLVAVCCGGLIGIVGQNPALGQNGSEQTAAKVAIGDSAAATAIMKRVTESLAKHSSVKADVEQTVSISNQHFIATGKYLTSSGKQRLDYKINEGQGMTGGLLQICDGKEMWLQVDILDNKRVTHRDVKLIKDAIAETKTVTDAVLTAELGLGGISGLLASLERSMDYKATKEESSETGNFIIVQGVWKPDMESRLKRGQEQLPPYIPDLVRITIDAQSMFPTRIAYLKTSNKEKSSGRAMLSLKFKNVEFDQPIAEEEFNYVLPKGIAPEDDTRMYIDGIKKQAEAAANPAAAANSAPAK